MVNKSYFRFLVPVLDKTFPAFVTDSQMSFLQTLFKYDGAAQFRCDLYSDISVCFVVIMFTNNNQLQGSLLAARFVIM